MSATFDTHAATYDADLAAGLSLTGENRSYFARGLALNSAWPTCP